MSTAKELLFDRIVDVVKRTPILRDHIKVIHINLCVRYSRIPTIMYGELRIKLTDGHDRPKFEKAMGIVLSKMDIISIDRWRRAHSTKYTVDLPLKVEIKNYPDIQLRQLLTGKPPVLIHSWRNPKFPKRSILWINSS